MATVNTEDRCLQADLQPRSVICDQYWQNNRTCKM